MNATTLRANLYRVLDRILETGKPVDVIRKGKVIRLVPAVPTGKLAGLEPRPDVVVGDPDDLIHCDWSETWKP